MDSRLQLLIFIAQVILLYQTESLPTDNIIDVSISCPDVVNTTATITVKSDKTLRVSVDCKGNNSFDQLEDSVGVYLIPVNFTGEESETCLFWKMDKSNSYAVSLEVAEVDVVESDSHVYSLVCIYDKAKIPVSSVEEISRSLEPPHELETHLGYHSTSNFSMELQDVGGQVITDNLLYRKKVRLAITMSSDSPTEKGFTVVHCYGVGDNGHRYQFLRSGCGEGHILGFHQGFTSRGFVATSPYFVSFKLYDSDTISYECRFSTCSGNCDGNSCPRYAFSRNKRNSKGLEMGDFVAATEPIKIQSSGDFLMTQKSSSVKENRKSKIQNIMPKSSSSKSSVKDIKQIAKDSEYIANEVIVHPLPIRSNKTVTNKLYPLEHQPVEKSRKGFTYEQKSAIVGCVTFLLMVCIFLFVILFYVRQKKQVEKAYRNLRAHDQQYSRTYLLDDME